MERRKLKKKKNPKQPTELPQQPRRAEGRPREIHVECCNFFFQNSFSERRTGGGQRLEQADPRRPTNRPNQRQKSTERFLFHPENRAERPDGIREVQWIPRRIEWIRFRTCNGQRRGAMLPAPNHAIHTVRNRVTNQICHLRTHGSSRERGHYETTGRAAILGRMLAIRKAHDWGRSLRTRTQLHTKSWLTFAGRLVTAYVHLARPAKPSDTVCDWNTKAKPGKKKKKPNSKYEPRKSTSDVRTTNCEPRKSTSGVRTWKNGRSVSRVEKSLIFVLSPSENRTVRQLRTNLGLSLNRSQWGGCSTDYDTQTENEIERVLRGRTGGTLGIPR